MVCRQTCFERLDAQIGDLVLECDDFEIRVVLRFAWLTLRVTSQFLFRIGELFLDDEFARFLFERLEAIDQRLVFAGSMGRFTLALRSRVA